MKNIREILNNLVQDCQNMDNNLETTNLSITQAIAEIKEVMLEMVGIDYPIIESLITERIIWIKGYNQAKKEIRQKIKEM